MFQTLSLLFVVMALSACAYEDEKESNPDERNIKGIVQLDKNQKLKKLVLAPGSRMITNGSDVTIEADELISEGGVIETFPEGRVALPGNAGRSGGTLKILARRAEGTIVIQARGENGGAGLVGKTGKAGEKGKKGQDGLCERLSGESCLMFSRASIDRWREWAKDPSPAGDGWRSQLNNFHCRNQTENGSPGTVGEQGGQGESGYAGGDSATVLIQIEQFSNIDMKTSALPGSGGEGGPGGLGGTGGPGGDAGLQDKLGFCKIASLGPVGANGPVGPRGLQGAPGKRAVICLKNGPTSSGDCEAFPNPGAK